MEVTLKKQVLDPQGTAVETALRALGYYGVEDLRVGKYIEFKLQAADLTEAEKLVEEMTVRLLSNPVIEDFSYQLTEVL